MKSITTLQVFSMSINTVYIAQLHNRKKSQKISHSKTSHPQYIFLEFLKFLLKLNVSELLYSRIKGYTHKNIQNASVNGLKSPRRSNSASENEKKNELSLDKRGILWGNLPCHLFFNLLGATNAFAIVLHAIITVSAANPWKQKLRRNKSRAVSRLILGTVAFILSVKVSSCKLRPRALSRGFAPRVSFHLTLSIQRKWFVPRWLIISDSPVNLSFPLLRQCQ